MNRAKAKAWDTPFTDVADWAKPYVGYAYANGLTSGTGTYFNTCQHYLTISIIYLIYSLYPPRDINTTVST